MSGLLDIQDFFAAGVGFDISGAYIVARGLLLGPKDIARIAGTYLGFNPHEVVARSRDRIDVTIGLLSLLIGFGLQALGYILSVGGFGRSEPSSGKAIAASAMVGGSVFLSLLVARLLRRPILLSYLVEIAKHDENGNRLEHPLNERVVAFANALGYEARDEQDGLTLAQHVFGKRRVEDTLVRSDSGYRRVSESRNERPQS